jgi:uncharacterized protein (TIGR00269 family)
MIALPGHNAAFCPDCFLDFFERQVEKGIKEGCGYRAPQMTAADDIAANCAETPAGAAEVDAATRAGHSNQVSPPLFTREERVLVALSGGKDSLALMLVLARLGYQVTGLHIDLAIGESSRQARAIVESFCGKHGLDLQVAEMAAEGLPIPRVKEKLKRPICSACGKIKRHYFNKAALEGKYDALATGHNLDDEIARLFSNILRWDASYLGEQGPLLYAENGFARKVKPLWRLGEYETASYAFLMGIDHHTMPCPFSKGASFNIHKRVWADLEQAMPGKKLNFYLEFLEKGRRHFTEACHATEQSLAPCERCGYPTSSGVCGVCRIKEIVR